MPLDTRAGTRSLVLLSVLVIGVFLGFSLSATSGRFVPAISDLYVVCQYAKAMAEGHPFHYNAGEPASTGATSLLHTAILAVAHALGARGEGLVAFAVILGAALFVASVVVARQVGERLAGPREGLLAGALVALGGPVAWGFLYGSDIALFLFLSLWLFERLVVAWGGGPLAGAVTAATLLALARPEGLPLALLVAGAWWLRTEKTRRRAFALPVLAGLAVLALNRVVAGAWLGSSVADKSLFANYGRIDGLSLASEYAVDVVRGLLLGLYPSQASIGFARGWAPLMFPPLGLLLVLLAVVRGEPGVRRPLLLWLAFLAIVGALDVPNMFMGVHFNRYLLWTFPSLLVLVAVGVGCLSRLVSGNDAATDRRAFALVAGLLLALGALSTLRFAGLYAEMTGSLARRELPAARWIATHLPPGARIASAATSVEYLTGHRNTNLHGVTSPAFFGGRTSERDVAMLEGLVRLPESERPEWLLSSEALQDGSPTLQELADGPPVYRTLSGSDELLVFHTRWTTFSAATAPWLPRTAAAIAGRREVDRLNVGDGDDERRHAYSVRSFLGGLALRGTARVADYALADGPRRVADAGRAVLGEESFRVGAQPGRDLLIVMRTAPELSARVYQSSGPRGLGLGFQESRLTVSCGGRAVAEASFRPANGWDEQVLLVPGGALTTAPVRLALSGHYASFRYWFYQ